MNLGRLFTRDKFEDLHIARNTETRQTDFDYEIRNNWCETSFLIFFQRVVQCMLQY